MANSNNKLPFLEFADGQHCDKYFCPRKIVILVGLLKRLRCKND